MESSPGFNSLVSSQFGEYQLETSVLPSSGQVVSKILRDGRVVDLTSVGYDPEISSSALLKLVRRVHEDKFDELATLAHLGEAAINSGRAEIAAQMGTLFLDRGFLDEAEVCYNRAQELDPTQATVYLNLAQVFKRRKDWERALKFLETGSQLDPQNPYFYYEEGVCLDNLGKEAKEAFLEALARDPDQIEAHLYLAYLLAESAPKSAQKELEAVRFHPWSWGIATRCLELLKAGEAARVRKELKEFIELMAPDEPGWLSQEFDLLLRYFDPKQKRTLLQEYLESVRSQAKLKPDPHLHNELGKIYLLFIKFYWGRAIAEFKRAIELDKDYEAARRNVELAEYELKGYILFLKGLSR